MHSFSDDQHADEDDPWRGTLTTAAFATQAEARGETAQLTLMRFVFFGRHTKLSAQHKANWEHVKREESRGLLVTIDNK
jgi:hypothetical protein